MTPITPITAHTAAAAAAPPTPSSKLHQAAVQFEGLLISNLWKSLQNDPLTASDDSDPGSDTMQGLGLQAMSNALAASGGLGIAPMIERQLSPAPPATPAGGIKPLKSPPQASDTMLVAKRPEAAVVEVQR